MFNINDTRPKPQVLLPPTHAEELSLETQLLVDIISVDTERCVAVVFHENFIEENDNPKGRKPFAYDQAAGIMSGGMAELIISSGVGRLTSMVSYGSDPENAVIFDPDYTDPTKRLIKPRKKNNGGQFEDLTSNPFSIKHEEGEKVLNSYFSGIKCGRAATVLFYGLKSRLIQATDYCNLESPTSSLSSGLCRIGTSRNKDGDTASFLSAGKVIGKEIKTIYKEFRGNVGYKLGEEKIAFDETFLDMPKIDEIYILDFIIDYNVDKYKIDWTDVKHIYKDRTLSFTGDDSKYAVNSQLKSEAELNIKDSRAIKGSIDDEEIAIPYLRAIDSSGNIYEFNAGDKKSITLGKKIAILNEKKDFILGNNETYSQRKIIDIQLPVSKAVRSTFERYGRTESKLFGRVLKKEYQKSKCIKINTDLKYEKDETGKIKTRDKIESPNQLLKRNTVVEIYQEVQGKKPGCATRMETESGAKMRTFVGLKGGVPTTEWSMSDGDKETNVVHSTKEIKLQTEEQVAITSKRLAHVGDTMDVNAHLSVSKGFITEGDFAVRADNIFLEAKRNCIIKAKDSIHTEGSRLSMLANESFFVRGATSVDRDGNPIPAPTFTLSKSVQLAGARIALIGEKNVSVIAEDSVVLSASRVVISEDKTK